LCYTRPMINFVGLRRRCIGDQKSQSNNDRERYTLHNVVRCYVHSRLLF
jgi:hypothetical protein